VTHYRQALLMQRKELIVRTRKCRAFIRLGWHVADARVELKRAQKGLLRLRKELRQ